MVASPISRLAAIAALGSTGITVIHPSPIAPDNSRTPGRSSPAHLITGPRAHGDLAEEFAKRPRCCQPAECLLALPPFVNCVKSPRTLAAVPSTTGIPSCETYWMNSARGTPENRAALPREMLFSRYKAVASASRMPGSSRIESPSKCTTRASGRWRFSTITGFSCAARIAAEGLFFNSRTLTAFITSPFCSKSRCSPLMSSPEMSSRPSFLGTGLAGDSSSSRASIYCRRPPSPPSKI